MSTKNEIVSLTNVIKNYGNGKIITKALRGIDLKILEGDFSVIMGPSGCGKSTMLNIIGGLDKATRGEVKFNGKDFNSLTNKEKDPIANIFQSAMVELIKTKNKSSSVQSNRVSRVLEISADNEIKVIEKHFTFLATVGSTAPFIGLFGTVWGIMNSFQSIAISRNTSLAIVAPGIAEALFATALGLLAAVPAVIAYNKFNSDSKRYSGRIENFSKRFISII